METIKIGLIKGRHEMPVNEYIIDYDILDPYEEYNEIRECINRFLIEKVGITVRNGWGINQASCSDTPCYTGNKCLVVYITGLTIVTSELVKQCMLNGVHLTLMHYNAKTGEYFEQVIC